MSKNSVPIGINRSRLTPYGYIDDMNSAQASASFRAWLEDNPVTLIYELATPTLQNIETPINLNVSEGYNLITTTNKVQSELDIVLWNANNFQIEQGNTITSYEPYIEKQITEGQSKKFDNPFTYARILLR